MEELSKSCMVTNIQHYSIHDGEGVRTTIFLKGCPLKCFWCANPENQSYKRELMYHESKCIKCFHCTTVCENGVIQEKSGQLFLERNKCVLCGRCAEECLKGAIKISGEQMDVNEAARECLKDNMFYFRSKGGVTISGGEALSFKDFCLGLAECCSDEDVGVTYETCGFGDMETLLQYAKKAECIFFDVKHHDPEKHRQATGVSNKKILENLKGLTDVYGGVIVRIPVVPEFNDSADDMRKLARIIREHVGAKGIRYVELLPYHNFGEPKYEALGRQYTLKNYPRMEKAHVMEYMPFFEMENLKCVVN